MKKIIVSILLCLSVFGAKAQTDTMVYETVEKMPSYVGGEEARQKFIAENLVYPKTTSERVGSKIIVEFIVEVDSSVSEVKTIKSFDDGFGAELVRIVKLMKWIPGEQRGKKVRVKMRMPIIIELQE